MKKAFFIYSLIALMVLTNQGCKKFLNIDPITSMSGNNYWKTKSDVEQFVNGTYGLLRQNTCMAGNIFFIIGDLRNTAWQQSVQDKDNRDYIGYLNKNNITAYRTSGQWWNAVLGPNNAADWGYLMQVVNNANIIIEKINEAQIPDFSEPDKKKYIAEAIFIRSVVYFLMVRHWGDVPYVTDSKNYKANPRTDQIEVFKTCIAELTKVLDDLPWTYSDPSKRGIRAMKGGALNLMMEMYMWMAGFDKANEMSYYQKVADLSSKLIYENGGAYNLLPINNYKEIFRGSSSEGLFEIGQNYNYGEFFDANASIANLVLLFPYIKTRQTTILYYNTPYLKQLYDKPNNGPTDLRIDLWFESSSMYNTYGMGYFQFLKYTNTYTTGGEADVPNDSRIIFRYADAFLLRAEALEKLGDFENAQTEVNKIRQRAGAELFTGGKINQFGQTLEDAIWWERERELMGESSTYYDLVRTQKILNPKYTPNPMPYANFLAGAWKYPISKNVTDRNPNIVPNTFWPSF